MPVGLFNPRDNANATSTRPAHANQGAGAQRWFTDSGPGTRLHAQDLNALIAQFRTAMGARGITDAEGDDTVLTQLLASPTARLAGDSMQVSDWNSAILNGWYRGANAANAPTNTGTSDWYEVRVHAHTSAYVEQIAWQLLTSGAADSFCWRRIMINNIWGSWHRLRMTEAELDTRYGVEVGTWTPTFDGAAGPGVMTYSSQFGNYRARGRDVHVNFDLQINAVTSLPTGNALIAGLPFAPDEGSSLLGGGVVGNVANIASVPANFGGWAVRRFSTLNKLSIVALTVTTGAVGGVSSSIFGASTRIAGSISYRRA